MVTHVCEGVFFCVSVHEITHEYVVDVDQT